MDISKYKFADDTCCAAEIIISNLNYGNELHSEQGITDPHQRAKHYLFSFGPLWWASIGLFYLNAKKLSNK